MSILEALELGQPGEEIFEHVREIKMTLRGEQDDLFEEPGDKLEYIEETLEIIVGQLRHLKAK